MKYPSISIDTYDFVVIAAMTGGFITHNWLPFLFFITLQILAVKVERDSKVKGGDK